MFDTPLPINLFIFLIELKNNRLKNPIKEHTVIYLVTYLFV